MAQLEKRPIQTKVKHEILNEYLRHWGYIITMGLTGTYYQARESGASLSTRFIYVDCLSFMGAYAPENNRVEFYWHSFRPKLCHVCFPFYSALGPAAVPLSYAAQ